MEKITYVVHAFQHGKKYKESAFGTLEEAREYAAYLGTAFNCVVLARQAAVVYAEREMRQKRGVFAGLMRLHS